MLTSEGNIKFIELSNNSSHTVFYKLDVSSNPIPYPNTILNKWDDSHVRMPCSLLSFAPVENNERKSLVARWTLIVNSLKTDINNIYDVKESIMSYNSRFQSQWNFDVLYELFENELDTDYINTFFSKTYPGMVKLALDLPKLVTKPIPLLKTQIMHSISLSQHQIASLLSHAFFCTFPRRNKVEEFSEYKNFPTINFYSLFNSNKNQRNNDNKNKIEKLKCILNYFKRVVEEMPQGVVTFTRRVLKHCDIVDWEDSVQRFDDIQLQAEGIGTIFSSDVNSVKIDFANKSVGGGVLNNGCVQEEILFVMQPELIVSRLFTEILDDDECLLVQGTETFNKYSGYAWSFEFQGDFNERAENLCERDKFGRWKNTISMIDAIPFRNFDVQFTRTNMLRDLNKAYCGFCDIMPSEDNLPNVISTGNWGCGSFGGDVYLKFILQLMACAQLKKSIIYYTFKNMKLVDDISDMFHYLQHSQCTVGSLWKVLLKYTSTDNPSQLFYYIKTCDIE